MPANNVNGKRCRFSGRPHKVALLEYRNLCPDPKLTWYILRLEPVSDFLRMRYLFTSAKIWIPVSYSSSAGNQDITFLVPDQVFVGLKSLHEAEVIEAKLFKAHMTAFFMRDDNNVIKALSLQDMQALEQSGNLLTAPRLLVVVNPGDSLYFKLGPLKGSFATVLESTPGCTMSSTELLGKELDIKLYNKWAGLIAEVACKH